jgi:hypothetical protein
MMCVDVGGITSQSEKCWQVDDNGNGSGIFCHQVHDGIGWLCWTDGGPCNHTGDGGCWAEDCPFGGPGGGGGGEGGNECHIESGTLCPASCMNCTYFYY